MKRKNGNIEFNETGIYKINDVSERYRFDWFGSGNKVQVKVLNLSSYQVCDVYTNKNTPISAYLSLNGPKSIYKVVFDKKGQRLEPKKSNKVLEQIISNHKFNCHGFCFLEGLFWLELDNKTINTIIEEDNYVPSRLDQLKERGVAIYYKENGSLLHSAVVRNGNLLSKFGINNRITNGEAEILKKYKLADPSKTKYFNPS